MSMIPETVTFARSIFVSHPSTQFPLGEGAEVWLGYQQAARPCQRGIAISINQVTAALPLPQPYFPLYFMFFCSILSSQLIPAISRLLAPYLFFGQAATAFVAAGPVLELMASVARIRPEDFRMGLNPRSLEYKSIKKVRPGWG